ncbi:MAG TPA: hypothetical protein VIJ25_17925 [Methylococcales bacterium]
MVSLYGNPTEISIAEIKQVKKRTPKPKVEAAPVAPVATVDAVEPPAKKQKTEKQIAAAEARRVKAAEKKVEMEKAKQAAAELDASVNKAKQEQAAAKKALAAEKRRVKKEQEAQEASPQSTPPPAEKHVNVQKMVESALKAKHANEGEKVAQKAVRFEAQQMVQEAMADPTIRAKVEKTQITSEQRLLRLMFPGRKF